MNRLLPLVAMLGLATPALAQAAQVHPMPSCRDDTGAPSTD